MAQPEPPEDYENSFWKTLRFVREARKDYHDTRTALVRTRQTCRKSLSAAQESLAWVQDELSELSHRQPTLIIEGFDSLGWEFKKAHTEQLDGLCEALHKLRESGVRPRIKILGHSSAFVPKEISITNKEISETRASAVEKHLLRSEFCQLTGDVIIYRAEGVGSQDPVIRRTRTASGKKSEVHPPFERRVDVYVEFSSEHFNQINISRKVQK